MSYKFIYSALIPLKPKDKPVLFLALWLEANPRSSALLLLIRVWMSILPIGYRKIRGILSGATDSPQAHIFPIKIVAGLRFRRKGGVFKGIRAEYMNL